MKNNLHTHTFRCKHAEGDVTDYCEAALANGLTTLGFSDHAPHLDGRWIEVRMPMEELPAYVDSVRQAQKLYEGRLDVFLGLEYEYVPGEESYVREVLMGQYKMDYLIGAVHWYPYPDMNTWKFYGKEISSSEICSMTDYMLAAMESGFFIYMAHPDLFGCKWRGWNDTITDCCRTICQASIAYHLPLEINAYGLRKKQVEDNGVLRAPYPLERFWEIAGEEGVTAVLGADAHQPEDVWGAMEEARALAQRYGVHLVDPVTLL